VITSLRGFIFMLRRSRKKIKDLGDMLENPEGAAYVGGDFEDYEELGRIDPLSMTFVGTDISSHIQMEIKYEGYIKRQLEQLKKFKKMEGLEIPEGFYYDKIPGLSREIVQKLSSVQPKSLGQASRISGITPAAMSVLMVYLRRDEMLSSVS